jgi:hypothetical protein
VQLSHLLAAPMAAAKARHGARTSHTGATAFFAVHPLSTMQLVLECTTAVTSSAPATHTHDRRPLVARPSGAPCDGGAQLLRFRWPVAIAAQACGRPLLQTHRLTQAKALRAFFRPGFLRSTMRGSRLSSLAAPSSPPSCGLHLQPSAHPRLHTADIRTRRLALPPAAQRGDASLRPAKRSLCAPAPAVLALSPEWMICAAQPCSFRVRQEGYPTPPCVHAGVCLVAHMLSH